MQNEGVRFADKIEKILHPASCILHSAVRPLNIYQNEIPHRKVGDWLY